MAKPLSVEVDVAIGLGLDLVVVVGADREHSAHLKAAEAHGVVAVLAIPKIVRGDLANDTIHQRDNRLITDQHIVTQLTMNLITTASEAVRARSVHLNI